MTTPAERLAFAIIQGQEIARQIQPALKNQQQQQFQETPRPLAYYYPPHHYVSISPKTKTTIYEFTVPPNHVFHIHQIANNWFTDTYSIWSIDGTVFEKVERWISSINAPLTIKDRYIVAYNNVRWTTYNNSRNTIISEVVLDGEIYLVADYKNIIVKTRF